MRQAPKFYKSIYYRLSLTFALVVGLLGLAQLGLVIPGYRELARELDQRVYWELASDIAEKIQPALLQSPNEEEIKLLISELNLFNPKVELYLLDKQGRVVIGSGLTESSLEGAINVDVLEKALEVGVPDLPMYLDVYFNRAQRDKIVFSVSRIILEGEQGYLLVALNSRSLELITDLHGQIFIVKSIVLGSIVLVFIAVVLAALLFKHLTRNFNSLIGVVSELEAGNLDRRIDVVSDDEVGYLARTINHMADRIQQSIKQRQEFIASISHDLRSPLTSIMGFVEMLKVEGDNLTEEQRSSYVEKIYRNVNLQNHLVNDLFELSKLNAEEKQALIEPFAPGELADDVVANFVEQARKKEITIEVNIPERLPRAMGDLVMVERVLGNLLTNAIRYTNEGGSIVVQVGVVDSGEVVISVSDTGVGIPEKDVPYIFDSFYRVDAARNRKSGGTGLGLAIVHKMIELQRGRIWVESEIGVGSTFYFSLPVENFQTRAGNAQG